MTSIFEGHESPLKTRPTFDPKEGAPFGFQVYALPAPSKWLGQGFVKLGTLSFPSIWRVQVEEVFTNPNPRRLDLDGYFRRGTVQP